MLDLYVGSIVRGVYFFLEGIRVGVVTNLQGITISRTSIADALCFMKPKGYEVPDEHYNLQSMDINTIEMNYENTH